MSDLRATEGPRRVVIEQIRPAVDDGRFAVKRIVGTSLPVTAHIFADGHDVVCAQLLQRKRGETVWCELPLAPTGNDEWRGDIPLSECGLVEYTIEGWVDHFETWYRDLEKRIAASLDTAVDWQIGAGLASAAAKRAPSDDRKLLAAWADRLNARAANPKLQFSPDDLPGLLALARKYPDRSLATRHSTMTVNVEPRLAQCSTWYELFPRSCSSEAGRHGTFRDVIGWLPRLSEMGFDVLYLPPIHPVGTSFRKGKNNALAATADDVGSPWAIGAADGGHMAIEKNLGSLDDFRQLVSAARELGIDIALDIAFQCSPDHPYVREHPQWFRQRPDGTIQYAENPPKKYQDIYPFDFENADWRALWRELVEVFLYWCRQGVRVFRVDNPHTKPFAFWEYLITEVKQQHPESIFLSEAFTRPKLMYYLAKVGFSQSYTYFTWRNTKSEFIEYFTELADPRLREFFRPNLWPNTPDILPPHLQSASRAAYVTRLVLAATLGANYGIYGPAFETMERQPREAGSEEYLDSEKYELKHWQLNGPESLRAEITRVNRARRENVALQSDANLEFHPTDNEQLLCYSKYDLASGNRIVVIVNLDFHHEQHGYVTLPLESLGLSSTGPFLAQDILNEKTYTWDGPKNFVELDPANTIAHILRL